MVDEDSRRMRLQDPKVRVRRGLMGAFYLARRRAFVAVGGFDERFFVYFGGLDLSLRLARAVAAEPGVGTSAIWCSPGTRSSITKVALVCAGKGAAPLTPFSKLLQYSSTLLPKGVTAPSPVTTTRLSSIRKA